VVEQIEQLLATEREHPGSLGIPFLPHQLVNPTSKGAFVRCSSLSSLHPFDNQPY
jgi:hypothetical protein